jgi:hypothetical protein
VRSTLGSREAFQLAAEAARRFDPTIPLGPETTFAARIDRQRLFAWMLGLLGTIGFVLAAVGLHGLIGQTVVERRREFGNRLAIGAAPTGIVKLVLRRAALVLSVGLAAGLALAWSSGRLVESQLFGITSPRSDAVRRRCPADDRGRHSRQHFPSRLRDPGRSHRSAQE